MKDAWELHHYYEDLERKVKSSYYSKYYLTMFGVVNEFIFLLSKFVALINKENLKGWFSSVKKCSSMKKTIKEFLPLTELILNSRTPEIMFDSCEKLWKNCNEFAKNEQIEIKKVNILQEII